MNFFAYNRDKDFKNYTSSGQKAVKITIKMWLFFIYGIKIDHIFLFTVKYLDSCYKYLFLYRIICFFTPQFFGLIQISKKPANPFKFDA